MTWVKPGLPGPCTNPDPSVVREGRKSFPSGHSSLAFSGWVYLALFLYDFLGAFLPPVGNEGGQVWTLFVATMPTLGAVLVGCSRMMQILRGSVLCMCFDRDDRHTAGNMLSPPPSV